MYSVCILGILTSNNGIRFELSDKHGKTEYHFCTDSNFHSENVYSVMGIDYDTSLSLFDMQRSNRWTKSAVNLAKYVM